MRRGTKEEEQPDIRACIRLESGYFSFFFFKIKTRT